MATISINQGVDVHWTGPSAVQPDRMVEGGRHVRTFEDLIRACRFALEKAAEGNMMIQIYPSVGPSLNLASAQEIVALADGGAIDRNTVEVEI
jgi:hypothetical protein